MPYLRLVVLVIPDKICMVHEFANNEIQSVLNASSSVQTARRFE